MNECQDLFDNRSNIPGFTDSEILAATERLRDNAADMTEQQAATPAPEPKPKTEPTEPQPVPDHPAGKPATKPEPKRKHRFVRWIRRHHRMLTFIGAVIVFATFVIKDALKEQLKDVVDSFARARELAETRFIMGQIQKDLVNIKRRVDLLGENTVTSQDEWQNEYGKMIPNQQDIQLRELLSTYNATRLLALLPETIEHKVDAQWEAIAEQEKKRDEDVETFGKLYRSDSLKREVVDKETSLAIQIETENRDIDRAILELTNDIGHRAVAREHEYQRRYSIAAWASWFLYALGWGLGLAGRMVGVEGIGDGGA